MQIYEPGERCSKCNGMVLKIEYQDENLVRRFVELTGEQLKERITERMQLTCTTCNYRFYRAPMDSMKVI